MKKYNLHKDYENLKKGIPFNKLMIGIFSVLLKKEWNKTEISNNVSLETFYIEGYKKLKFKIDIFIPKKINKKSMSCIFYAHGGAFAFPAVGVHKKLAAMYAEKINSIVVFPDYHLAPKYPFPAGYEDIVIAYRWMCENANKFNIDKNKILVAGDSAGGALAANLVNNLNKDKDVIPLAQILIYPVIDNKLNTESMKKYIDTPGWDAIKNKKMWEFYLKNSIGNNEEIKKAVPMKNDLNNKIKTYIETAEYDCLRDEAINYANKLKENGFDVELNETLQTIHGYEAVFESGYTQKNIRKRIEFLEKILSEN